MINEERLADTFLDLVRIDSISREEAEICGKLKTIFEELGGEAFIDDAGSKVDGNCGNLIVHFPGKRDVPPLMLNAHMDTVEPGRGVTPIFADGVFQSDGSTILGADDKSAVAILLEVLTAMHENGHPCGPVDVVLTVCEEIGLLGARHLDFSKIRATFGYALDATDTEGIVVRAPSANRIEFTIHGRDAHAGAAPEKGISAIAIAGRAIDGLALGRLDRETTCNIGIIRGGLAHNIVPSKVEICAEARSHDEDKLAAVTERMVSAFESAVEAFGGGSGIEEPRLETRVERDFTRTHIADDHPVLALARRAGQNLGREIAGKVTGGGADANIFFEKGIVTGVLGTGMRDMHTVRENVRLSDMVRCAELVSEILRVHAEGGAVHSSNG
jgi:tripeptide aminopeptidase